MQGVGPLGLLSSRDFLDRQLNKSLSQGYSMTLFQSLATSAGFDPTRGSGSSCTDAGASGQCVLPWAGGTKAVSSIVLIANGVSFAVRINIPARRDMVLTESLGHDDDIHDYRLGRGLWQFWALAAPSHHCHLLGCPIR